MPQGDLRDGRANRPGGTCPYTVLTFNLPANLLIWPTLPAYNAFFSRNLRSFLVFSPMQQDLSGSQIQVLHYPNLSNLYRSSCPNTCTHMYTYTFIHACTHTHMHRVLQAWSLQPNSPFMCVFSNLIDISVFLWVQWAPGHLSRAWRGFWGSCTVRGQPVPGMKQVPSQQPCWSS